MLSKKLKTYTFWILLCEAVGGVPAFLTRDGMKLYNATANKPALTPPMILFPIVWTILYALMGIGIARVRLYGQSDTKQISTNLFITQLVFNFFWSLLFFNARAYGFSLIWLGILWILVLFMALQFRKSDKTAAYLQIPYVLWLSFAFYLNYEVMKLN